MSKNNESSEDAEPLERKKKARHICWEGVGSKCFAQRRARERKKEKYGNRYNWSYWVVEVLVLGILYNSYIACSSFSI